MAKQLEFQFSPTDRQVGYQTALTDLREWISSQYEENNGEITEEGFRLVLDQIDWMLENGS